MNHYSTVLGLALGCSLLALVSSQLLQESDAADNSLNEQLKIAMAEHDGDEVLIRQVRAVEADPKEDFDLNLAWNYDANYHVAFAMLGFTTVFIAVTIFGLAVAIWNIDPGRDTIIFRMTSQRKKDQ